MFDRESGLKPFALETKINYFLATKSGDSFKVAQYDGLAHYFALEAEVIAETADTVIS